MTVRERSSYLILGLVLSISLWVLKTTWAYEVIDVTDGGTISGEVRFVGTIPELEPIKVYGDRKICGDSVLSEALIVSPGNRGIKNAVVYMEGITRGKKPDLEKIPYLDNINCRFVPHVQAVVAGTKFEFRNSDPILHNAHSYLVFSYPRKMQTLFNLALPLKGEVIEKTLSNPGFIYVQCAAHWHMSAWILSFDHPYFTLTDDNGHFFINDIPPGKYKVKVWHEGWRVVRKEVAKGKGERNIYEAPYELEKEVVIPPKGNVKIAFDLSPQ